MIFTTSTTWPSGHLFLTCCLYRFSLPKRVTCIYTRSKVILRDNTHDVDGALQRIWHLQSKLPLNLSGRSPMGHFCEPLSRCLLCAIHCDVSYYVAKLTPRETDVAGLFKQYWINQTDSTSSLSGWGRVSNLLLNHHADTCHVGPGSDTPSPLLLFKNISTEFLKWCTKATKRTPKLKKADLAEHTHPTLCLSGCGRVKHSFESLCRLWLFKVLYRVSCWAPKTELQRNYWLLMQAIINIKRNISKLPSVTLTRVGVGTSGWEQKFRSRGQELVWGLPLGEYRFRCSHWKKVRLANLDWRFELGKFSLATLA